MQAWKPLRRFSISSLAVTGNLLAQPSSVCGAATGKVQEANQSQDVTEAVLQDFLHLRALIERAVSGEDVAAGDGDGSGDFSTLLQRLRRVVADGHRSRQGPMRCATSSDASAADEAAVTLASADEDGKAMDAA